jgi:hypothetical protein
MAARPGIILDGSGPVALEAGEVYNVSSASMYAQGFENHGNTATDSEYVENGSMYGVLASMSGTLPGYILPDSPDPLVPGALTVHLSKIAGTYGYSNVSAQDQTGDTSHINSVFSAGPGDFASLRTNMNGVSGLPINVAGDTSMGSFVFSSDSRDNQGGFTGSPSYLTETGNSLGDSASVHYIPGSMQATSYIAPFLIPNHFAGLV